jgi:beta-lactamase class D
MWRLILISFALTLNAQASEITPSQFAKVFNNYYSCFILYHVNTYKIISEYNPNHRCNERISPDSTFKVALSLMVFNQGMINQNTIFKWDGKKRELPDWNQDLTPHTWLKYSALWISQQLTPHLGLARIKHYLAGFNYGNQDFSGDLGAKNGLQYAWLSSSLKISAVEQLNFLQAFLRNELPIHNEALINTKKNLYQGKLDNGADYYGKTGSGRHGRNERLVNPSLFREGWFIGFIEAKNQQYIFVSNISDKTPIVTRKGDSSASLDPPGGRVIKPITLKLLNEYFNK